MEGIVAQNNALRLRFVDGVVPRKICRVVPYIEEFEDALFTENEIKVELGELDKKQGQGVLVEVLLPPKQEGRYRISQAEYLYDVPGATSKQKSIKNDIVLHFSDDDDSCKTVNPKVMNMAERVSAYNLQTRALQQAAVGDLPGATQKLKAAATRLLDLGEQELADTALQEVENLEQRGVMTSGGTKKLHYETRKLTQRLTV
jgi:Ca-activated chloride channel family protein